MEEGKSSRVPSYFAPRLQPIFTPSSAPCSPRSAGFINSNQWFLEEGGEQLTPKIKGMILDFIRGGYAVYR